MPNTRSSKPRERAARTGTEYKINKKENKHYLEEDEHSSRRTKRAKRAAGQYLEEITNKEEPANIRTRSRVRKRSKNMAGLPEEVGKETSSQNALKSSVVGGEGEKQVGEGVNADADKQNVENDTLIEDDKQMPGTAAGAAEEKKEEREVEVSPPKKSKSSDEQENQTVLEKVGTEELQAAVVPNKIKRISLKSQNTPERSRDDRPQTSHNLPEQLLTVLSNLYLNVGERLRLDFTPRCLDDLAHCHRHHYRSELPKKPTHSQALSLRCSLQQQRYVSFMNFAIDMCHRGEFPDLVNSSADKTTFPNKTIFTKLIELVLSINYMHQNNATLRQSYHKSIELFSLIVRTFPPCWHKMRPCYMEFLRSGLDTSKISSTKEQPLSKSTKLFDILLDLVEQTLKSCSAEELTELGPSVTVEPKSPPNSLDVSLCSEYYNQYEWEQRERNRQTFGALVPSQRLERLFVALRLLLQILENDMALWMLHHNKKTKDWIFCAENRPLVVALFDLTMYTRVTRVGRRLFSIFASAAAKGLRHSRLQVLERFLALLMVASNTADMENTAIGVKYPYLGDQTKNLIREFFKIFKAENQEDISKYIEIVQLLRIPYVRYEFIDHFLHFTSSEPLTPQKIAYEMLKKRWLKYKPVSELSAPNEDLSREQYLRLLLDALQSYCAWHGSKTFLHVINGTSSIRYLKTTDDSVHRWPTHGSGVLVLKKMSKDIVQLEQQLIMSVRMSKPKVDLPLADICIDEAIITKYRNDLKFVMNLYNVLQKHQTAHPEVDFSDWLRFLSDFAPRKRTKEMGAAVEATMTKTAPDEMS